MKQRRSPGPACQQSNGARFLKAAYGIPSAEALSTVTAFDGVRTFVAGYYHEATRTFYKFLKPGHILQKPPSIALQACVVENLHRRRCEWIAAVTPDGDVLTVPFALFTLKAEVLDRGYGAQLALPLRYWTSQRKTELQPALTGLEV
ncbi:MAG: hypothetical protein KatS3mg024_2655 [Armatimonadota bacterium]|nr:MAG: hypothetical protein KatS3mg024_2655 [Armatimonadota bacterium]